MLVSDVTNVDIKINEMPPNATHILLLLLVRGSLGVGVGTRRGRCRFGI